MATNGSLKVQIFVESRYRIDRKRVKAVIDKVLKKNEVSTPVEVSVAVVGDRKMRELSKKYKGDDKTHNVLSFSQTDGADRQARSSRLRAKRDKGGTDVDFPRNEDVLRLGDIVISYPEVIREASQEEVYVDDKVDELVEHGLLHLLGLHHEE